MLNTTSNGYCALRHDNVSGYAEPWNIDIETTIFNPNQSYIDQDSKINLVNRYKTRIYPNEDSYIVLRVPYHPDTSPTYIAMFSITGKEM